MGAVRKAVKSTLIRTGLMSAHYRRTRARIRILMYHGVSDRSLPAQAFEQQLQFLKSNFDFAWVRELPELLEAGPPDRPVVALTFDDGRANNADVVAPLLAQHGIKATFFLVPGLMDGPTRLMWNHELLCRLLSLSEERLAEFLQEPVGDPMAAVRRHVEALKQQPHERKIAALKRARELTGELRLEPWMAREFQLMSWDQARALPDLIEIGSHTVSHPVLTRVPVSRAEEEIVNSRVMLEQALEKPVRSFCYPNGDLDDQVAGIVSRHYDAAVSTNHGTATAGDDLFRLRRIAAPRQVTDLASALR